MHPQTRRVRREFGTIFQGETRHEQALQHVPNADIRREAAYLHSEHAGEEKPVSDVLCVEGDVCGCNTSTVVFVPKDSDWRTSVLGFSCFFFGLQKILWSL